MTTISPRSKTTDVSVHCPATTKPATGKIAQAATDWSLGTSTSKLLTSSGNPRNPITGKYESGGSFFTTRTGPFVEPAMSPSICDSKKEQLYTGPIFGSYVTDPSGVQSHHESTAAPVDENSLNAAGTTAISQCAPVNPSAKLGTTLAESVREGIPSLPGIQSWRNRADILRAAGSEYLNYQFGWAPLVDEIHKVVSTARHHRDILQNYRHNEGKNVHRRFDFDSEITGYAEELSARNPNGGKPNGNIWHPPISESHPAAQCVNRVEITRKRWFEGCFTYGGPSRVDSFGRAIGFGSDADALFGLSLSPTILWELTPWSWAVDWFTNAGDLINNVTNFALAGLVMRYGYMMEETISKSYTYYGPHWRYRYVSSGAPLDFVEVGPCSTGIETVRKIRVPANPFGFGIGWEGLSPTQLAITAAVGITRLL